MKADVRFLVADDEKPIRDVICAVLRGRNYDQIETAENGREAHAKLRHRRADVLITDLVMPEMGGEELSRLSLESDPDITILVATGNGTIENAVRLMKDGVFDFFTKPFAIDELQDRIRRSAERARSVFRTQNEQQLIDALMKALESKDPYLRGHGKRVSVMAGRLARIAGWSCHRTRVLECAALVHDVGKIGVPEHLLSKPGRLTTEEMEFIKKHPVFSKDILEPATGLEALLPLVYHHHERYDGGGYPDGIAGDDIPEGARIISICDTYDAMRSTRAYQTSIPEPKILEVLEKERGKQLDAFYVDLFLDNVDEIRYEDEDEDEEQFQKATDFACV
jgi:putative two-component system response regulator